MKHIVIRIKFKIKMSQDDPTAKQKRGNTAADLQKYPDAF